MGCAIILAAPRGEIFALVIALGGPWAMGWHLMWQMRRLKLDDADRLLELFRSNRNAGLIPVLFFAVAILV
jgi:4-hydroxybenzoate polyprenyltransferase